MRIAGNYNFTSTRDVVRDVLSDLDVLADTLPGCQQLERIADQVLQYTLTIPLLAVRGTYKGQLWLEDTSEPYQCQFKVESSSTEGSVRGTGMIALREEGDLTIMDYGCEFHFGGAIASVSRALLDDAAKVLINQSLHTLARHVEQRSLVPTPGNAAASTHNGTPEPGRLTPSSAMTASVHPDAVQPDTRFWYDRFVVPEYIRHAQQSSPWSRVSQFFDKTPWALWLPVAFLAGYGWGRHRRARINPGSEPDGRAAER